MGNRTEELRSLIQKEIASARFGQQWSLRLHVGSVVAVIAAGAATTFFSAVATVDVPWLVPALALVTTIFGTLEKTFGFRTNAMVYRSVKTGFQNLELEFIRLEGDLGEEDFDRILERFKTLRLQKAEETLASASA